MKQYFGCELMCGYCRGHMGRTRGDGDCDNIGRLWEGRVGMGTVIT